jgi:hypothetical protein
MKRSAMPSMTIFFQLTMALDFGQGSEVVFNVLAITGPSFFHGTISL